MQHTVSQSTTPAGDSGISREVVLAAERLSAGYGLQNVFRDISFSLCPGELTAVIGPNGSGKTTLLQALCGIHRPSAGVVKVADKTLRQLSRREIARHIAFVPQDSQLDFHITVEDAVSLGRYPWLGPMASPGARDQQAIESALGAMALEDLLPRPLQTLSGGERQRVLLARALAQETPVLLLDEPAASLDLRFQQEIFSRLKALASSRRVAVLVAEHHLNLVAATCDRVLVIHDSRLWADGAVGTVITEAMIGTVFGARMQVLEGAGERPQCVWRSP